MTKGWLEPNKQTRRVTPEKYREYIVATEAALSKHTKEELVNEVIRLQQLIRSCAIELGIAQRSKNGERAIDPHFASNIINLIKAGWTFNLE